MSSLLLHPRRESARTVLALVGELDMAAVPELRRTAVSELGEPACSMLVLELGELSFVDSTGLGCWIELRNIAEAAGKSFVLESVPPAAVRTLKIAGLAGLFGVVT